MSHSEAVNSPGHARRQSRSALSRRSAARRALWIPGVLAALVSTSAALAAAPRLGASYTAGGAGRTVVALRISAHGRIATYSFKGTCTGEPAGWFFDSRGERAIPVRPGGSFSLRRTEPNAAPNGNPGTAGTFTFTLSGRFGARGRTVSGKLSFVSTPPMMPGCRTGTVAFHGRLVTARRH